MDITQRRLSALAQGLSSMILREILACGRGLQNLQHLDISLNTNYRPAPCGLAHRSALFPKVTSFPTKRKPSVEQVAIEVYHGKIQSGIPGSGTRSDTRGPGVSSKDHPHARVGSLIPDCCGRNGDFLLHRLAAEDARDVAPSLH